MRGDPVPTHDFAADTQIEQISIEAIEQPLVRLAVNYWLRLRGSRPYPARSEISLRVLAPALKHMVLAKVEDEGADFLLKVVGDDVARRYCAPLINRRMSAIAEDLPTAANRWIDLFRKAMTTGEPLAVRVKVGLGKAELTVTLSETVCLPFGPEGGPVDHLITVGQSLGRPAGVDRIAGFGPA